ncbi:hypothetical protein [Ferrimonas balearica]|uniref:hypothetical protein n=1 Tax=Ferrimonas balearica TaxID=44012 RepID=UPI001C9A0633|nr:hypothetical protein [Ferrimonas balearica]MBY5991836.1 hypothetical protein [Ferrimonas balearica]
MKLKKLFPLSALASALVLAGCGGDININTGGDDTPVAPTPPPTEGPSPTEEAYGDFANRSTNIASVDGKEVWTLSGTLSGDIALGNDVVWELTGAVIVGGDNENSGVLTIAEGTKVLGNSNSYLVVSRGSQIEAVGSADAPIVFTSVEAGLGLSTDRGQWGGLVLLGNAPVNTCADLSACDVSFEVGNHLFGGDQQDDNSGTLKYVRVENGGFKLNDTQEMNGISFGGVGAGTTVDYIQVDMNDDDGIEFWGGTVNVSHVVLTGNNDDSLDWTNGWTGAGQFIYIQTEDDNGNRGIEADSSKSDPLGLPMSQPVLANVTLNLGGGTNGDGDDAEGILFRVATGAHLYSTLVKGSLTTGECLEINGADTVANAQAGDLTIQNSLIDCVEPFKNPKDDADNVLLDVEAWFMGQDGNLVGSADLDGYLPNASSPALGNGTANLANIDSRLMDTDYIGAFDGANDWTQGWTIGLHDDDAPVAELQPLSSCPVGTVNDAATAALIDGTDLVCTLSGNVTQNVTLLAGTNVWYKLAEGAVVVGGDNQNAATLAIEAGANIFGDGGSYLVVSRGSKIMAKGNEMHPITFTSEEDALGLPVDRGQWGGLVLLGNAEVNTCPDKNDCNVSFEVGNHLFGGNNNADSSGELSHVVVKYGGFKLNDTQEMNGISFGGVGSGTLVEYIQVHGNDDDGVEFWGGSVNLKYVYLTDNNDDSLDWTNGWTGKAQYVYIQHEDNRANRGIEADSSKSDPLGLPYSDPLLSNVTIEVGAATNGDGDDAEGILLRVATRARLHNVLVKGQATSGECLEINDAGTEANAADGSLVMTHSLIDCVEAVKNSDSFDTSAWFLGQEGNQVFTGAEFGTLVLTNGQPASDSAALGSGKDMSLEDSFFDATDYIGAFDGSNDWTQNWTFSAQ